MADVATETAQLLADLRTLLEKSSQFILDQAPPLAKEIVVYGRTWNTIVAACAGVACILLALSIKRNHAKFLAWIKTADVDDPPFPIFALIAKSAGVFCTFFMFWFYFSDAILAWCAPRLFIIQYLTSLLSHK